MTGPLMRETTLDNIADGAAVELFQHELKRIAKNIADPNTKPTAKRKITLTFEFAPDEVREEVHVHVSVKATIANTKGYTKTVYAGKRNGVPTIFGNDQKQLDMLDEDVEQISKKRNTEAVANA